MRIMLTLTVRGLPTTTTETGLNELFAQYGKVFRVKIPQDFMTGQARGFASIDMEGHEARAAIAGLNGREFNGQTLYVDLETARKMQRRGRR